MQINPEDITDNETLQAVLRYVAADEKDPARKQDGFRRLSDIPAPMESPDPLAMILVYAGEFASGLLDRDTALNSVLEEAGKQGLLTSPTSDETLEDEFRTILQEMRRGHLTPEILRKIDDVVKRTDALSNATSEDLKKRAYASLAFALDAYAAFPEKAFSIKDLEKLARDAEI